VRIRSLIGVLLATLFIVSIVALAIPIHSSVTIETLGQWETLANAPATWGSNNGHRIEAMGNYIYFWVGDSGNGFYRYDPSDLSWHSLAAAPFTSSYAVGMVAAKDPAGHPAVYIIGGTTSANSQKWYRYTEYNNSWSGMLSTSIPWTGSGAQTNCNKPANGSEFVWDNGDIIYFFPGSGYSYNRYDWYKYTISTNTWTYINEFNTSGDPKNGPGNSACLVTIGSEKYIYIQFGHTPSGNYTSAKFMRYQISTGSWWTPAQTGYGADDGADLVWDGGDNLFLFPGAYIEAGSGGCDEYRFLRYSISGNTWANLTEQPFNGNEQGNDDGGAAGIVGNYIYKLKGNDTNGDTASTLFYRYQFRNSSTPTATATGPTGSTNNPSVSITYTYTLTPTSVKLYYTKSGGTSWTLAGEDTSIDGTFAYNITSGDGTYGWIAVAIGGGSTETDPPAGSTPPEAASLILDTTPPTSSVDAISSYWKTSTSFTVTASASDALSGLNRVALWYRYSSDNLSWGAWTWFDNDTASPWSWTFTSPSGNGYYQFYSTARDNAGNEEATPGAADTICGVDNTPPTSSVNAISPYWQISTSFTATAVASDALSGVARVALWYRYSSDNSGWGSWTWFDNDNTSPFSWTFTSPNGNGYYQFYSRARDNAGNEEAAPGAADAICGVDNIPPTSSINAILPYWQTSTSFTVNASANDSLSGVARVALWYRYSSDNSGWGSWTWFDNDNTSPFSWTFTSPNGSGYYQFYSTSRDNAGNEEAAPAAADTICGVDNTPPTSSVNAISPYWQTSTSFTVTVTSSDALSGVTRVALWYRYSSDNSSWGSWTWFDNDTASPWSWTFTSPNGNGYYQFYSRARDNAGNEEAAPGAADAICGVDNTLPNALTPHGPILIVGNDNFTLANGVTSGSGIVGDPYVIENYIIDASTANGIEIRDTTAYFVVRNCIIENGWIGENVVNYYGIKLDNAVNGRIENCTCRNDDYGIVLYANSDNNVLTNNTCENSMWYGIRLESLSNNTITNNICENTKYWGIGLDHSDNNTLDNNTCENNGGGIYLYDSDNIKMRNNNLSNNRYNFGMEGTTLSHFVHDIDNSNLVNGKPIRYLMGHSNEVIGSSPEMGYLGLVSCDNIRVENLVLEHNVQGILIAGTQDSRVENCVFENNAFGIYLWGSENNTLTNNTCENGGRGIQLLTSDNNTLSNNTCEDDNYFGIRLAYSNNNTIKNSTFSSDNEHGVRLNSSNNNLIENNTISNDNLDGIWFENSNSLNNTIRNNSVISNNRYGIYILNSNDNNHIYHNNFLNNENQAYDNGSNYWDNGYPSGGNYWSDYSGLDENNGENQDIPGSDRIGDTPYNIPGDNNRDRYPLMNPTWGDILNPPAPTLLSPANGENLNDNTPTLDWNPVDDASLPVLYRCYVDNNSDFSSVEHDLGWISATEYTTPALAEGTWYWKVGAKDNAGNVGDNSAYRSFRIDVTPPCKPTLVSPDNNSTTTDNTPTFTWTRGSDADNHRIEVDNNSNFSSPIDNIVVASPNDNTWTKPSPGYANGTYYWRVWARNTYGENVSENTWQFTVITASSKRGPIHIIENAGFTPENGVNGGGSGTENDPYIIENWVISALSADGISIQNTTAYFVIQNCLVENGGGSYYGIHLNNAINGKVENNICRYNSSGVYLESSSNYNILDNSTYGNNYYGIELWSSDNNLISNNVAGNNNYIGIYLEYSDNNSIHGNTSENNGWDGIRLGASDNNLIYGNTSENNQSGIYLASSEHVSDGGSTLISSDNNIIDGNVVANNSGGGIRLDTNSDNNLIHGNISDNNYSVGISLWDSDNNIVDGNTVENSYWYGIFVENSDNNFIYGNTSENNSWDGIYLGVSNYNLIENNIVNNNHIGIEIPNWEGGPNSSNNVISNNIVENNSSDGIYLGFSSYNNVIFHNNIVNNTNQAYDAGANYWDDGYPSGGNYWSDYTGVDENHGENQNIPGSDGIGDTPYNIPGDNNRDRYPLVNILSSTWINTGDLENARHVYSLLCASDGAVYAGTASGDDPWDSVGVVFKTTDGGTTWVPTASLGGLGVVGNIEAMIQTSGGTIDNNIFIGTAWEGKIFRSTNGGDNWIEVVDLTGVVEVDSLIQAANGDLYAGTHYGGTNEARIYRSTDYGNNWQVVAAPSIDGELSGCTTVECLIQASTGHFYCGTQPGHVWRSDNGDNWYKVGDKDINFGGSYKMYSLLDASNGYIYAASRNPGNVYRSTDNGNTWAEVANGVTELGGATRTDAFYQASNGRIYVGTDVGKIYRSVNGDNWILEANLPADRVNAIIEGPTYYLYAGTSYNGDVFKTYIPPENLWTGTVTITLDNLYSVTVNLNGDFGMGSNLVAKFYTYGGGSYQDQTVVCSENIPGHVTLNKHVSRPGNGAIQRIKLLVTDSGGSELGTIKIFETSRPVLVARMGQINGQWPFASEAQRTIFVTELGSINALWPFSPETFEDP
jgi:parallel beta-helix repeat protein